MAEPSKDKKYHYTYLILNLVNDMKYIGARSCNCLPIQDTQYMGSSRSLKKIIEGEGLENFLKIILVEFPSRKLAVLCEIELHKKYDVGKNSIFYNKAKQTSNGFDFHVSGPEHPMYGKHPKGRKLTEEEKEKLRLAAIKANTGKKRSKSSKQKQSKTTKGTHMGKDHHMYGKHFGEEFREKQRAAKIKKVRPLEARRNMSKAQAGDSAPWRKQPLSLERRNKIGESLRNRLQYIYVTPVGEFSKAAEAGRVLQCARNTIIHRCKEEFEGYYLKPVKSKKEEFFELYEQGLPILEISKIMKTHNATLYRWKNEKEGRKKSEKAKKRLTLKKVLEIRYLFDQGAPAKILAKEFDIDETHVYLIGKRQSWSHIPEESPPISIDPDWQKIIVVS